MPSEPTFASYEDFMPEIKALKALNQSFIQDHKCTIVPLAISLSGGSNVDVSAGSLVSGSRERERERADNK